MTFDQYLRYKGYETYLQMTTNQGFQALLAKGTIVPDDFSTVKHRKDGTFYVTLTKKDFQTKLKNLYEQLR